MRTDQVWDVSLDIVILLCDLACLLNDLCLPGPRCFWPVYLNHEVHAFQATVSTSRISQPALGIEYLCRTSLDPKVTLYLAGVFDINLNG